MLNEDLKDVKDDISKIKYPRLSKILASDKIDSIITKVQAFYNKISSKLILKYNLEDELKQGKIFTIIIAILAFILLVVVTLFSVVTLNSIIGVAFLLSLLRQIVFCIKWGYTIIKNKGDNIKKYLSNLFPNSKILAEAIERKKIPLYEEQILYQIEDILEEIDRNKVDLDVEKEITIKLKEIVNLLNIKNNSFKEEYHSLDYKQDIAKRLSDVKTLYIDNINKNTCQEDFLTQKNELLEQINDLNNKVYVKRKYPHNCG